ncbi:hypothetical protein DNK57_06760 [Methanothermobacter thermautotrophicus]|uniref:Zn-dependent metallo-hydrolase RNA specificity domain-containing protein n=1 Tax=Methanothermobacter thermautotrophicus TaxID=145262 RepID=A0A842YLP7_METTF|nr:MBL fold metallo-hydrolase RNA specificity domain-containing protein [Methanothermobacter thermautotrophicus]MBE2900492.1 hypothetical protein [Methanothermobacter thermautotrophicus]
MHASGHASGPEILEAIREIEPEKVYPIHTENKRKIQSTRKRQNKNHKPQWRVKLHRNHPYSQTHS